MNAGTKDLHPRSSAFICGSSSFAAEASVAEQFAAEQLRRYTKAMGRAEVGVHAILTIDPQLARDGGEAFEISHVIGGIDRVRIAGSNANMLLAGMYGLLE